MENIRLNKDGKLSKDEISALGAKLGSGIKTEQNLAVLRKHYSMNSNQVNPLPHTDDL